MTNRTAIDEVALRRFIKSWLETAEYHLNEAAQAMAEVDHDILRLAKILGLEAPPLTHPENVELYINYLKLSFRTNPDALPKGFHEWNNTPMEYRDDGT